MHNARAAACCLYFVELRTYNIVLPLSAFFSPPLFLLRTVRRVGTCECQGFFVRAPIVRSTDCRVSYYTSVPTLLLCCHKDSSSGAIPTASCKSSSARSYDLLSPLIAVPCGHIMHTVRKNYYSSTPRDPALYFMVSCVRCV